MSTPPDRPAISRNVALIFQIDPPMVRESPGRQVATGDNRPSMAQVRKTSPCSSMKSQCTPFQTCSSKTKRAFRAPSKPQKSMPHNSNLQNSTFPDFRFQYSRSDGRKQVHSTTRAIQRVNVVMRANDEERFNRHKKSRDQGFRC